MATVTSLGFNITARWDGAGLKQAQAQLDALKKSLSSIDGQNLRITVDVDDSAALAKLDSLRSLVSNQTMTVNVNADTTDAAAKLTALTAQLDKIGATRVTATAAVNVNAGTLDAVQSRLGTFGATHETATANVDAQAGQLDAIRTRLNQFGTVHSTATADVNAQAGALDTLIARLTQFGNIHATATASVNANSASLDLVQARLAVFGATHETATADVNVDNAHLHLTSLGTDLGTTVRDMGSLAVAAGGASQVMGGMASAAGGAGSGLGSMGGAASGAAGSMGGLTSALTTGVLWLTAIVALAPIAAASVALIPVAFAGAAAILIGTNKQLSASFSNTFSQIAKTILPLAMPAIQALQKALEQVNAWFKLLGPAIHEAFAAAAPLIQPLLNIVEKLAGAALPGFTSAMQGMKPLIDGLGEGALKLGGYLGQAADVLARIPGLGQAMSGIMGALGQVVLSVAQAIAQVVSVDHGQALIQLLQAFSVLVKASIPLLQFWAIEVAGLSIIIRALGDVLIALEVGFKAFFQFLQGTGPIMTALGVAWNATVSGMKIAWAATAAALTIAWNATWTGIKIVGQATWTALGIAWNAFVNGMKIAWTAVSTALVIAWNAVWNGINLATKAIWSGLQIAWAAFVNGLTIAWNAVSAGLTVAWNAVWNAMSVTVRAIWAALQIAWSAFITAMTVVWNTVSAGLSIAWNAVWNAMSVAAKAIWTALQIAWSAFITAMATVWNTVSAALQAAWSAVWNAMATVAKAIWAALQAAWQAFITAMTTIWNAASAALQATWSAAWNAMKAVATAIWTALQDAWHACVTALTNFMTSSMSAMGSIWSAGWNAIKSAASAVWNWLTDTWHSIVTTLTNFTSSAVTAISNLWETAWNHIKNVASSIWDWLTSTWHSAVTTLTNFTSSAVTTISNLWESAWNHIKSFASGVWNDLTSAFGKFKDGMISATKTMVGGMKDAWDAIKAAFEKPIHFIIDTVINGGIIKAANWVIDKLGGGGSTIPNVPVPFATGGYVAGPGTGTSDSIPARLSNGEYVLKADAVSKIGVDTLHQINRTGDVAGAIGSMGGSGDSFGGLIDVSQSPQLAAMVGEYAGGLADGGLSTDDLAKVFLDAIKSAGGAAADIIGSVVGGAGDVAGDIVGGIGGLFGHPHAGDSLKGHADDVAGAIQAAFGFLEDAALGPITGKVFDLIADKLLSGIEGDPGPLGAAGLGFGKMVGKDILGGLIKKAFETFLGTQKQQAAAVYSSSVAGSKSVKAWGPTIIKALAMEHLPMSWLGPIESMMQQESGGNPNAINRTDSNAQAGHPSQGLMQTIPSTFSAYHWPGTSNNILDPLANIAAALNYIKHRYGYPPGSPYANGTTNATPGVHLVGENGPEMVLFGGGETVKTAADTSDTLGRTPGTQGGIDPKQIAANEALWKSYMTTIQNTSNTAWKDVSGTATGSWGTMQSGATPFAAGLVKTFGDAGTKIADASKASWDNTVAASTSAWTEQKAAGDQFTTGLIKTYTDTGAAIKSQWTEDWTANNDLTTKTWADQTAGATQFGSDIQKTYADTSTAIQTTWTDSLTAASAATTQYWNDVGGVNTTGAASIKTDVITPVTTMFDTDLPAAFTSSITAIGAGWEALKTTVRDPVAAVVDVVFNKGIVAMWNAIAGTFDAPTLDTFTMPGYAVGGQVSGPGTGTSDSITARLSNGEHVWTAAEVQAAGGHGNVAALRQTVMGGAAAVHSVGANGRYATGGAVVGAAQGGTSGTTGAASTGNPITDAANAPLGSIKDISNPFITAAGEAGKSAISNLLPGTSGFGTLLSSMVDQMVGTVTGWITANDVLPTIGGINDAAAQAWADSQVGKPYVLGGDFVNGIDCSEYQSGIARAILGETPAPWFTTFAFEGDTAPSGFEQGLTAPYMVGITNVGVGHMAGTLNGKNYEATPPAVRSGPSARGYDDPMFTNQYGFRPSIEASIGAVTDANHLAIIDAAMAAAGVPPPDSVAAWESGMNTIINRESAWDPNAINLYDSNAAAGMPSQGLAQVIPPTFAAYHVAGTSENILDPVANVAAAINYIVHTYGSIGNVQQANPNLPPKGYEFGTPGAQRGWHTVGEKGPEWVNFRGGEEVLPNGVLPPSNGGGGDVSLSIPITVQGNMDSDAYQRVENELVPKLRMMLQQRGKGRRG